VQRQYCGSTGKTDNCVITVNLGYAANGFHTMIDTDLYLPEEAWHLDRDRCRRAGIPEEVVYRPKWRIALELLERSMANGVQLKHLTADEEYGRCGEFRRGVAAMGLTYVVEVPCDTKGWKRPPALLEPEPQAGPGRPRVRTRLAPEAPAPRRVDGLWKRGGPGWEKFRIKDTEKGPVVWKVRAVRFRPWESGLPGRECWLLVARNVLDGEVKYFLSNAPEDTPVQLMLHVAFSRWRIERIFQDSKGQVGLDHFEVRNYLSLTRHLILSMVSLLFLMKETRRLRGEKSLVEPTPGAHGGRGAA
jgi:SRSO17 transposase